MQVRQTRCPARGLSMRTTLWQPGQDGRTIPATPVDEHGLTETQLVGESLSGLRPTPAPSATPMISVRAGR